METKLYVGNLSRFTSRDDLSVLFSQAGDVTEAKLITERKSGESKRFAIITMSAQSEADHAVSMFNGSSLFQLEFNVRLVKPRGQRGLIDPAFTL